MMNKGIDKNESDKITTEIPTWVLPTEEITFYVKINKNINFTKIEINIPKCFEVKDFINVYKHTFDENILCVTEIGESKLNPKKYFGVTIASKKPFDELAVQKEIKIKMIETNHDETEALVYVRVFRPYLEIEQIPDYISLNDVEETTLPIHLRFKGFGDISIRIEANIGGELVSEGGRTVIDELVQGFLREGVFETSSKNNPNQVTINKLLLLRELDKFKKRLDDEKFIKELKEDDEITQETIDWLMDLNTLQQDKFMNVLYDTMEGYMIKRITDVFARNIGAYLQIDSGTNIVANLKTKLTSLYITINYEDLVGNLYPPLTGNIEIRDNRKSAQLKVNIPIEIEKVYEDEAYKNVRNMRIDHGT
ncbi:MAG: hypothetical protein R1F52_02975 [Candidatus Nitrosoabyssus spongiisocia]|nr:MAG: hypothetical protein R1F52_02975 [Nitrosopumilaceae archaeon AB1(1)]